MSESNLAYCPQCNGVISNTAVFCPHCGDIGNDFCKEKGIVPIPSMIIDLAALRENSDEQYKLLWKINESAEKTAFWSRVVGLPVLIAILIGIARACLEAAN